ncbi:MAG: SMP-30/gluconolactonase/LRE family protein, partial [Anaerolineales bacterium]
GARALKYDATGTGLLAIGRAGFHNAQDDTFENPAGISVDSSGKIWVVDQWSHRVAYYDSSGVFQGEVGVRWESGSGNDHLNAPRDAAFDSAGKLYIADTQNHRVQVFDFVGGSPVYSETIGVSGVAGADDAHFDYPTQLAFDSTGRLYVLDRANRRVQRCEFTTEWTCSTFFGETGVTGNDLSHLDVAYGLGIDSNDNIFIADSRNFRVLKCDTTGTCAHFAGTNGELGSDNSHFAWPTDAEVDSNGNVYVADWSNHRIQKFDSGGNYLATVGVTGVPYVVDTLRYNSPFGIAAASDGSIYLAEDWGYRLIKLDSEGNQVWTAGEAGVYGSDNSHFGSFWAGPQGNLGMDSQGRVYIADTGNHRVRIFSSDGVLVGTMGGYGTGNDQFDCPAGVAISPINDDIYVVDRCNQRIQVFDSNRIYKDTIGVTDVIGSDNDHFNNPRGIAVDDVGNVYVADSDNHRVQVFNSSHNYQRTLGVSGECGDDFAHFYYPYGVAVDSESRSYVASGWSNNRVEVFDSSGAYLTRIGGNWGTSTGEMRYPVGVAIDQDDNVYVTEYQNHRIQKYAPGYAGWVQTNINGFGDREQGLPMLEVFDDQLYAGTWNLDSGAAQVWRTGDGTSWDDYSPGWSQNNAVVFDLQAFEDNLYAATGEEAGEGEIWRTDGSTWEQAASGGFGDSNNSGVNALAEFDGALYAATTNYVSGTELWRSSTGNSGDWAQVNADGFGSSGTWQDVSFEVYGGILYVGLSRNGVAELWRSGDGTVWNPVFQNGLGNTDNTSVSSMEVFQGEFYIGIRNVTSGGQLWRSSN